MDALRGSYKWEDVVYKDMVEQNLVDRATFGVACNVMLEQLLALPDVPRSGTLLELGTGDGYNTVRLAKWPFEITSVEVSPHAVELARRRLAHEGIRNVRVLQADATALIELGDASFDVVVDSTCLHCIVDASDRRAVFREVQRVLKDAGSFLGVTMSQPFIDPYPHDLMHTGEIVYELLDGGVKRPIRIVRAREDLQTEFEENGLNVVWSEHKILRKEPIAHHFVYHAKRG
jgi:ubiquinone/menaquinone biosynthesis C-methylase UbiE